MMFVRIAAAAAAFVLVAAAAPAPDPVNIPVTLGAGLGDHQSGRLLVFVKKVDADAKPDTEIDTSPFSPKAVAVAAREVSDLRTDAIATIDGETDSFPKPFSSLEPGTYRIQAVLDRNHDYNYGGRATGDLVSDVVQVTLPGPVAPIALVREVPATDPLAGMSAERHKTFDAALAKVRPLVIESPSLTKFWGHPVQVRGWVALPPGYDEGKAHYPTVYSTGGFGSSLLSAKFGAVRMVEAMTSGDAPPMIWVYLDESSPTGTHEFADSVNNGPWGQALTTEVIPTIEKQYRMDARSNGRFLTGHSSGGWATLWLQVAYPKVFGGTWPTSPDPSDFHDFTNANLYEDANFYAGADGVPHPLIRDHGKVIASLQDFGRLEGVLGSYGGQFASFEWVFSPRGPDGRPMPVFDRATGAIDPMVAAYWRDHYDIAHIVARDWKTLKPDLDGKIHLTVGTADTFYLDGPAHRLQAVLDGLGAKSSFRFLPDKTHSDLFERDGDRNALMKDIAWEMYAVARPKAKRPQAEK